MNINETRDASVQPISITVTLCTLWHNRCKYWGGRDLHPSITEAQSRIYNNYFSSTSKRCLGLLFCRFIISTHCVQKNHTLTLQGNRKHQQHLRGSAMCVCQCRSTALAHRQLPFLHLLVHPQNPHWNHFSFL